MNKEISNLLLIGIDLVGLAYSSKRAGYKVYALDYFCDRDLKMICETCLSTQQKKAGKPQGQFNSNFDPSRFVELANQLTDEVNIDAILLSSGFLVIMFIAPPKASGP